MMASVKPMAPRAGLASPLRFYRAREAFKGDSHLCFKLFERARRIDQDLSQGSLLFERQLALDDGAEDSLVAIVTLLETGHLDVWEAVDQPDLPKIASRPVFDEKGSLIEPIARKLEEASPSKFSAQEIMNDRVDYAFELFALGRIRKDYFSHELPVERPIFLEY